MVLDEQGDPAAALVPTEGDVSLEVAEDDFPGEELDVANDGLLDDGEPVDEAAREATANAADRGWGTGWPHCSTARIVTARAGGEGLRLPVRQEIAELVQGLVGELEAARRRLFRPDWCWGFACRPIKGTRTPSNHSWGLAIDLDAPDNPQQPGANPPGRNTMPPNAAAIAEKYGFRWGGVYRRAPDPMHFEFMGTPAQALERSRPDGHRVSYPGPPPLKRGSRGPSVLLIQKALDVDYSTGPGIFGPRTSGDGFSASQGSWSRRRRGTEDLGSPVSIT